MPQQSYVKEKVAKLSVEEYYKKLMKASMDKDSIYIHAKETMQAFFEDSNMTDPEKAGILSGMLTQMVGSITANAMSTALAAAKEDRDAPYQLTDMRESTLLKQAQRDKLNTDNDNAVKEGKLIDAKRNELVIKTWAEQAQMQKDLGVDLNSLPTSTDQIRINSGAVKNSGIKWEQTQQIKAGTYAAVAKSYRENGSIAWTLDSNGHITGISDRSPSNPGLTKRQEEVAIRQKKAFDDNMIQHAANSSANMIGLLLSADEAEVITEADANMWRNAVSKLANP